MPPVNVSGPFYAMPEEFENEGFTLKTHKMFSAFTRREEFKTQ